MELGLSPPATAPMGERTQGLPERLGPFRLAYLEALFRVTDWRATARKTRKQRIRGHQNDLSHEARPALKPSYER
jgi:hypothetical protein